MRRFLHDLPFVDRPRDVPVRGLLPVQVKPYQLAIWISLSPPNSLRLPVDAARLPALLDTGHNHNCSLRERHLLAAGFDPEGLIWPAAPLRIRDAGGREMETPRVLVDVWIHSNLPRLANRPFPLRLGAVGAACYRTNGPLVGPPLPIIGMRALCLASVNLDLHCRPSGGTVNLRVPAIP